MLRSSLTLAGLVALGAAATAQQARNPIPAQGPVRDGGIYHAATNTWTRKASSVNIGADIIYNNTVWGGFYTGLSGDTFVDEGRIPSPSSPTSLQSQPGCALSYTIDGVQVGYCSDQVGGGFTMNFYEAYTDCSTAVGLIPQGTAAFTGPGGIGVVNCWVVTVDLAATPFSMLSDGDSTFVAPAGNNLFGWSLASTLPAASQLNTGPMITGDLSLATGYDGTIWDPTVNLAEDGTGMSTTNHFFVENGPTTPGCYYFGGLPMSSFHLELYATACGPTTLGTPFCFGDGSGTACPCANNGATGNGCANSLFPGGSNLSGTGTASISADTAVLTSIDTPNSSVLFFQGTIQQTAGAGAVFGDGKRCAGGTVVRLGTKNAVAGVSSYPGVGDQSISVRGLVTAPGTRTYQAWYRNAAAFCTASTFNLSNGLEITWNP